MPPSPRTLRLGAYATATSCLALAAVAVIEGRSAVQPLNATSHWLNGDRAARRRGTDWRHTGTGLATHAAACVFWAALYERWTRRAPDDAAPAKAATKAVAVSAFAALIDYTITPRRFTPGWELVLSKRAMAAVYAAMAAGFALTPTR